ncbi:MAG: hypothetical protein LBK99_08805 [Opitutaceae bacterium]|jgi:hypothetical protein|nr:hypothetical protein [Opitutaceae bacterium]
MRWRLSAKERPPRKSTLFLLRLQELLDISENGETTEEKRYTVDALSKMSKEWGITPLINRGVRRDIVESIGQELQDRGLVPVQERHDFHIVAEAVLAQSIRGAAKAAAKAAGRPVHYLGSAQQSKEELVLMLFVVKASEESVID